ncbi:MAG: DUF2399 domain-containing protein [Deltaproteobacteria bacterium]|nr:DUF2399 domain-containing protein [Deltaproteobacteria bacterium]
MLPDPIEAAATWEGTRRLGPVWDELARRMGASERPVRRIDVVGLDADGRRALAGLLGLRRIPEESKVTITISKFATALQLDDQSLRGLVERLRGPLDNRAAIRAAEAEARSTLWAEAEARLGSRIPATLARLRAAGVPDGDVGKHRRRLRRLADALDRIPCDPPMPLPMLAWEVSGDPHALDHKRRLAGMLSAAVVELCGHGDRGLGEALTVRTSMLSLGVLPDRLSTPTIAFGLRASEKTPLGRLLEAAAEASVPVTVPGALLDAGIPEFRNSQWLCVENPSLVEAAAQARSPRAIVCTSGWASADTQRLLHAAVDQGVRLAYAGDFDGEGLKIAAWMSVRFAVGIEMSAKAYGSADLDRALPWRGDVPDTPWDPGLAAAIRRHRRIVYQEDPQIWRDLVGRGEGDAE